MLKMSHTYDHNSFVKKHPINFRVLFLSILMIGTNFLFATMQGQTLDNSFKPAMGNGSGSAERLTIRPDGKTVVSGIFSVAGGLRRNSIVLLNQDGTVDESFDVGDIVNGGTPINPLQGSLTISVQDDNKLVVGGRFSTIGGQSVGSIARLNADGSFDTTFNTGIGTNDAINVIRILEDGKILLGGEFQTFNSQSVNRMVRLNSDGSIDNTFSTTLVNPINDIAVQKDGKLIVVGADLFDDPANRTGVARLSANGITDSSFVPDGSNDDEMKVVKLQPDGKMVLGGRFSTHAGGQNHIGTMRLNTNGSVDNSYQADVVGQNNFPRVYDLEIQNDGKIIIVGNIVSVNGTLKNNIARVNSNGTLDTTFTTSVEHGVISPFTPNIIVTDALIMPDQSIRIAGKITTVNSVSRPGYADINSDGTLSDNFSPGFFNVGKIDKFIHQPDGKLIVSGFFTNVNNELNNHIIRFNIDGTIDNTFDTGAGANGFIHTMALQNDGKVIVGGRIRSFDGTFRKNIARLNTDGSLDISFTDAVNFDDDISEVVLQDDGKVLVGGEFTTGIKRLNQDGTEDTSFDPGTGISGSSFIDLNSIVVLDSNKLIIGGEFSDYNGVNKNGIALLNADGSLDQNFTTTLGSGLARKLVQQHDGKILIGGSFTSVNGVSINNIARINPDGSLDNTFSSGNEVGGTVYDLIVQPDNKIILGGFFTSLYGQPKENIARINSNGLLDQTFTFPFEFSFNRNPGALVNALILIDQDLIFGGLFSDIGSERRSSIAKLTNVLTSQNKVLFDFDGDGKSDISIFRPSLGQWWLLRSSDGGNNAYTFGVGSDKPVPADYTGDGKTDIAFFRESSSEWFVLRSEDFTFYSYPFGTLGDIPAPGDFDGDGMADTAVYRPSNGTWYIVRSSDGNVDFIGFGISEDKPVVGDYDGDGMDDVAIYRPSNSQWWLNRSSDGVVVYQFGQPGDKTVQGDHTGDGKADVAFWRPTTGEWFVIRSEDQSFYSFPFGTNGDIPSPGDYDGDGVFDVAVFRPLDTTWYINGSTSGTQIVEFGLSDDIPLANSYVTE